MSVTIYHNPACGTSRNTLARIRQSGEEPEVIEYLKNRIAAFTSLPLESIDRLSLGTRLRDIGRTDGSTSRRNRAS